MLENLEKNLLLLFLLYADIAPSICFVFQNTYLKDLFNTFDSKPWLKIS